MKTQNFLNFIHYKFQWWIYIWRIIGLTALYIWPWKFPFFPLTLPMLYSIYFAMCSFWILLSEWERDKEPFYNESINHFFCKSGRMRIFLHFSCWCSWRRKFSLSFSFTLPQLSTNFLDYFKFKHLTHSHLSSIFHVSMNLAHTLLYLCIHYLNFLRDDEKSNATIRSLSLSLSHSFYSVFLLCETKFKFIE
jgi:hypothetical protein